MDPLSLRKIAEFARGSLTASDAGLIVSKVSTDSRTVQPGDLFVALRGENFDGHKFVEQVSERGAVGAMVEESWKGTTPKSFALIRVPDALAGYQNLAENYRRSYFSELFQRIRKRVSQGLNLRRKLKIRCQE